MGPGWALRPAADLTVVVAPLRPGHPAGDHGRVDVEASWSLLVAALLLVGLAVAAVAVGRLRLRRDVVTASVRAVAQLGLAALVIGVALQHLALAFLVLAVMYAVAVLTAARRGGAGRRWPWVALAIAAGWLPVLVVVFATGAVALGPQTLIAIGGIVLGGTMSATSLATRRAFAAIQGERGAFEAALALGLLPRDAASVVTRRFTAESLYPALDQTRTVGVVTLPGAFIGVLLGGGSPAQAAAAQVLVLVGLLAAEAVAVVVATGLVDRGLLLDAELRRHQALWS